MLNKIPRRAFFCWGGGAMPWVSRMAIESFRLLHPHWRVDVIQVEGDDRRSATHSSDLERYKELAENGGCYFDTDIIFLRSIEPLLDDDSDTYVCFEVTGPKSLMGDDGAIRKVDCMNEWFSIASLFSCPGNEFYRSVRRSAVDQKHFDRIGQQFYGVPSISARFETLADAEREFPGHKFRSIPRKAFLPVKFTNVKALYRDDAGLYETISKDQDIYGLHWYGGDRTGRIADGWTADDYWRDCALGKAIEGVELARARRLDSPTYEGHGMSC